MGGNSQDTDMLTVEKLRSLLPEGKNLSSLSYDFRSKLICQYAEKLAQTTKIKRTQLRKYFNEIKQLKHKVRKAEGDKIPEEVRIKLKRLIALLAYAASPKRGLISKEFYELMSFLINKVSQGNRKDFEIFEEFFEAIIAYHTYYKPWEE